LLDDVVIPFTRKVVPLGSNVIYIGNETMPAISFYPIRVPNPPLLISHADGTLTGTATERAAVAVYPSITLISNASAVAKEEMASAIVWVDNCAFADALLVPSAASKTFATNSLYGASRTSIISNAPSFPACSLRITGPATALAYQTVLRQVYFNASADNPSVTERQIFIGLSNNDNMPPYDAIYTVNMSVNATNGM
jgi:hypothetical protein